MEICLSVIRVYIASWKTNNHISVKKTPKMFLNIGQCTPDQYTWPTTAFTTLVNDREFVTNQNSYALPLNRSAGYGCVGKCLLDWQTLPNPHSEAGSRPTEQSHLHGGNNKVLFNNALNSFYLRLYGIRRTHGPFWKWERKLAAAT